MGWYGQVMTMQLLRFDGLQHINYRIIVLLSQSPNFW